MKKNLALEQALIPRERSADREDQTEISGASVYQDSGVRFVKGLLISLVLSLPFWIIILLILF